MLKKTIPVSIYSCKVKLIVSEKIDELAESKKWFNVGELGVVYGFVASKDMDEYHVVLDKDYLTYNTIVHEISHLGEDILKDRDIAPCGEPLAYLNGYLAERIFFFINKAKLEIK